MPMMDMAALAAADGQSGGTKSTQIDKNGNHADESEIKLDGVGVEVGSVASDHPPSEDIDWDAAVAAQQRGQT